MTTSMFSDMEIQETRSETYVSEYRMLSKETTVTLRSVEKDSNGKPTVATVDISVDVDLGPDGISNCFVQLPGATAIVDSQEFGARTERDGCDFATGGMAYFDGMVKVFSRT